MEMASKSALLIACTLILAFALSMLAPALVTLIWFFTAFVVFVYLVIEFIKTFSQTLEKRS